MGIRHLHLVDLRIRIRFDLIDADLDAAEALLGAALDPQNLSLLEFLDGGFGVFVPKGRSHGASFVCDFDVDDAAIFVLTVAVKGPNLANREYLGDELCFLHAGFDIRDATNLALADLVSDEHRRCLLIRESPHLLDFLLDGLAKLLERNVGLEVLIYALDVAHSMLVHG